MMTYYGQDRIQYNAMLPDAFDSSYRTQYFVYINMRFATITHVKRIYDDVDRVRCNFTVLYIFNNIRSGIIR